MPLNLDAVGASFEPTERSWSSSDCLLYALGVGAGSADAADELEYTTENSIEAPQWVLPTFAAIIGGGGSPRSAIGTFDPAMLLHGEQGIEVDGPIPPEGSVRTTGTIAGIFDKGSGALVVTESASVDAATGQPRFRINNGLFIRGEGGFGGDRGPSSGTSPFP
ncbi:MAG: enoyl-CoA hydratase, partial [Acidimicrobiales bacterium]